MVTFPPHDARYMGQGQVQRRETIRETVAASNARDDGAALDRGGNRGVPECQSGFMWK